MRAYSHDPGRATRRGVLVGASAHAKRLRDTFANETDARRAAQAEWLRIQRGAATFELDLPTAEPRRAPQTPCVQGFTPAIDGTQWPAIKVTHSMGDGGFTTRVELETAGAAAPSAAHEINDSEQPPGIATVQPLHYHRSMPTIARLARCTITMYAGDHLPPHFHVRANDGRQALVSIHTLEVLSMSITRRELAEALAWAGQHQAALATKWQELNP